MKNALELTGPDAVRLTIPGIEGLTIVIALHEPGLFFNKLEHMSIMDTHLANRDEDKFIVGIWTEKVNYDRQKAAKVLANDFPKIANHLADQLEKVFTDMKVVGKEVEYILDGNPNPLVQSDPDVVATIVRHTTSELLRRVMNIMVEGQTWSNNGFIGPSGTVCPNHPALAMGNSVLLQHPSGTYIHMVPRDDCNVAEGEESDLLTQYKESGGMWFDVFFGDVPYRGLITHNGHRLETAYCGSEEDLRNTVMTWINEYYPILFSSRGAVAMFEATFHLVGKHRH